MENKFEKYLGSLKVPFNKSKEQAWKEVYTKTIARSVDTPVIKISDPFYRKRSFWVGAAASLTLLISVGYLLTLGHSTEHIADVGEMKIVELPDQSEIVLNANSTINYDAENWSESRKLFLDGEAFFSVEKGSSFTVETSNGQIRVLGTSFNVYSRDNELNVSCKTGKVEVNNENNTVLLTPGLCTYSKNGRLVEPHSYDAELVGIWQQREYYHFENVPLQNVFDELSRQFSVTFELNDVPKDIVVNADINIQQLDKALNVVCTTYGLRADKRKNSVYNISKN